MIKFQFFCSVNSCVRALKNNWTGGVLYRLQEEMQKHEQFEQHAKEDETKKSAEVLNVNKFLASCKCRIFSFQNVEQQTSKECNFIVEAATGKCGEKNWTGSDDQWICSFGTSAIVEENLWIRSAKDQQRQVGKFGSDEGSYRYCTLAFNLRLTKHWIPGGSPYSTTRPWLENFRELHRPPGTQLFMLEDEVFFGGMGGLYKNTSLSISGDSGGASSGNRILLLLSFMMSHFSRVFSIIWSQ